MAGLCKIFIFVGLILLFVPGVDSVTEDDVKECGSYIFGRVLCSSVNTFYRECIVPGATSIDLIKLHQNFTEVECSFKDTFGFRGNAVWVNKGCSGEFYVCYEGVRVSTDYPVLTVTVTPPAGKTPSEPDVAAGSTSGGTDDVVLYIIIVVAVVLIVGLGLLVGCFVKQRQYRDRAKHLAEKRQASIDQRAHKNQIEENTSSLPMATRSLSMESVNVDSSSARNGSSSTRENTPAAYERDGSVCSSQSTMSEFTSVSAQTTGHIDNFRPFPAPNKRSSSLSDINPIGIYSEVGAIPKQIRSDRSSHSSLESIREVCNKYQMVDIPIERRYKKKSEHKNKYSTVGFSGSQNVGPIKSGTMTLPIKRTKTRAVVHVNPPHIPNDDRKLKSTGCNVTSFEQHYHDPDMLNISKSIDTGVKDTAISVYDKRLPTEEDEEYAIVDTCKPSGVSEQNTDSTPIYATVTKSCLKYQHSENVNSNSICSVSFKESDSRKKEANNNVYTVYGKGYSYLASFKPQDTTSKGRHVKELSMDLTASDI